MAENSNNKAPTHTAFAFKREGRKFGRWLEIGVARAEESSGLIRLFLDRLPIGGFTGGVLLAPIGTTPPLPEPPPRRPGQVEEDDELDAQ
jgi:hypothetical protein